MCRQRAPDPRYSCVPRHESAYRRFVPLRRAPTGSTDETAIKKQQTSCAVFVLAAYCTLRCFVKYFEQPAVRLSSQLQKSMSHFESLT